MQADSLKLGVQAARAGEYQKAQAYFIEVVKSDPDSEKGWLYLGHCLEEQDKKLYCYEMVLKLNPQNQEAKRAIASFGEKPVANLKGQDTDKKQTAVEKSTVTPVPERKKQPANKKKSKSFPLWLLSGIGVGVLVCFGLVAFGMLQSISNGFSTTILPTPTPVLLSVSEKTVSRTPDKDILITPSVTPTRTPRPTQTLVATETPFPSLTPGIMSDTGFSGSILYWDQFIEQNPENADAYYRRAKLHRESAVAVGGRDAYVAKLDLALKDIDRAIALQSDLGDYYSLRENIYSALMSGFDYQVDYAYLNRIGLDNSQKALQLGTSAENAERTPIINMIASLQCERALSELQKLMAQTPSNERAYGGLLHIQSRAYACLGRLNDAIKSVDQSMFNNVNLEYKKQLKVIYLYQTGKYEEALSLLNELIACCENAYGYRYYWRAAINYELGRKELVDDDLMIGMARTWDKGGVLPYVKAQLALEDGRKQDAIQLLQFAEATLDPTFNTLRRKIQRQLATLGAKPLEIQVAVPYQATPIP